MRVLVLAVVTPWVGPAGVSRSGALPAGGAGQEAARGSGNLINLETGAVLRGEIDVQNQPWDPAAWRAGSLAATAWSGSHWIDQDWQ